MTEFEKAAKYTAPRDMYTAHKLWNAAIEAAALACERQSLPQTPFAEAMAYNLGIDDAARAIRELKTGSTK